jgi:hypothetical protein
VNKPPRMYDPRLADDFEFPLPGERLERLRAALAKLPPKLSETELAQARQRADAAVMGLVGDLVNKGGL